jgi:hypothetical protein
MMKGEPGIDLVAALLVEAGHQVQIVLQQRRKRLSFFVAGVWQGLNQFEESLGRFGAGLCIVSVQPVQAGPGMGVEDRQGSVFLHQVPQNCEQNGVFEDVGVVSGVEGVAVTEHGWMVTPGVPRPFQRFQAANCLSAIHAWKPQLWHENAKLAVFSLDIL